MTLTCRRVLAATSAAVLFYAVMLTQEYRHKDMWTGDNPTHAESTIHIQISDLEHHSHVVSSQFAGRGGTVEEGMRENNQEKLISQADQIQSKPSRKASYSEDGNHMQPSDDGQQKNSNNKNDVKVLKAQKQTEGLETPKWNENLDVKKDDAGIDSKIGDGDGNHMQPSDDEQQNKSNNQNDVMVVKSDHRETQTKGPEPPKGNGNLDVKKDDAGIDSKRGNEDGNQMQPSDDEQQKKSNNKNDAIVVKGQDNGNKKPHGREPQQGNGNLDVKKDDADIDSKRGNVYLLGTSVTRHYGVVLCNFLKNVTHDNTAKTTKARREEKKACQASETFALESCDWGPCSGRRVKFMWKVYLGEGRSKDTRDICADYKEVGVNESHITISCLRNHFQDTKPEDLLVIGGMGFDEQHHDLPNGLYDSSRPFSEQVDLLCSDGADQLHRLVPSLLDIFPGTIVWLGLPWINVKQKETCQNCGLNVVEGLNDLLKRKNECTAPKIARHGKDRMVFLDTFDTMRKESDSYIDFVHHIGPLSTMVTQRVYKLWEAGLRRIS